jgi:hypothetical protein
VLLAGDKSEYPLFEGGGVGDLSLVELEKRAFSLLQETMTAVDRNTNNILRIKYGFMSIIYSLNNRDVLQQSLE